MSTLNHFFPLDKSLNNAQHESNFNISNQGKMQENSDNDNYIERKMDIFNYNSFRTMNQYDRPNKFYKIGPYITDQIIGKGNFSVVKLATHIPTQMQVAIKILHKSKMSKDTLEKTYREVHIMKHLNHPYIIKLYQVIDSVDWLFIVMEYAWNGELFDQLTRKGRFSEADAKIKFGQILDAVEHCHHMNIVHRDLKAENLLLDKHQNIKLADFGFGSYYENSYLLSTWCGSPPYAAPELFKGEPYNGPRADIWSLGVILYAMVCGTLPFDEPSNIVKLREQVLSGWVRFPYFLSLDCEHLIRMILNRSPLKRPTITTIKNHKWMQPTTENLLPTDSSSNYSDELWGSPSPISKTLRCNTLGGDSGFDEPISDFHQPSSKHGSMLMNVDSQDFEFNEHTIQIMERCGISRAEIYDELMNKKYGSCTATYLLLCERLRTHRQSYPPLKAESSNSLFPPSTVKSEASDSVRLMHGSQNNSHTMDALESINANLRCVQITERQTSLDDRCSPYENMKNYFKANLTGDNKIMCQSEDEGYKNAPFRPTNIERISSDGINVQELRPTFARNMTPVVVDVLISNDQALKEIASLNKNTNCSGIPFHTNEKIQMLPASGPCNPSEYLISYPVDAYPSRHSPNLPPQSCFVIEPSRNTKDTHIQNGIKSNNNAIKIDNCHRYSNVCPLQSNTCQMPPLCNYVNLNHNRKLIPSIDHHCISPRPIMTAAQSINAPPGLKNCFYVIHNDHNCSQGQQSKCCANQIPMRNQCSDSSLPADNNFNRKTNLYGFFPCEMEMRNPNLETAARAGVEPEAHSKNVHLVKSYNTPMLMRANNFLPCKEQIIPCQPHSLSKDRYILSHENNNFIPVTEIPVKKIPAFNVIPVSKFCLPDMNYIKFS